MRLANRNEIHLSSSHVRGKISMQAAAHSDKAKSRRSSCTRARSPACRIKAQQTSNTSSHAKQHAEACPPRRNPSPCKSTNRSTFSSHESSRNPAEGFGATGSSRETREWRMRRREECGMGEVDEKEGPRSVTESTIKRHFRSGNSRYLKLRSQISNAENRCWEKVRRWITARRGWLEGRRDGRSEKNCGERWGGKSGEFFLFASCLRATGCPDDGTRIDGAVKKNDDAQNVSLCRGLRKKFDKNEGNSNHKKKINGLLYITCDNTTHRWMLFPLCKFR